MVESWAGRLALHPKIKTVHVAETRHTTFDSQTLPFKFPRPPHTNAAKNNANQARRPHPPHTVKADSEQGARSPAAAGNGQRHRRAAEGRQDHAAGRHGVPGQAAGVRGHRAARPPGVPAPRLGAGQAARRPRAPARAQRAAPSRQALLPRRAAQARRAAAPGMVRRAPHRRARAARVAHAHPPLHLRPLLPHRRHRAGVASCVRGRPDAAPPAPAQGAGGQAHGREQGCRRGRRQDHAARQRGRERRRDSREVRAADARAEPDVRADGGLGHWRCAPADARAEPAVHAHAGVGRRQVLADAGAEPEVRRDARVGLQVHDAHAGAGCREHGEDAGQVALDGPHAGQRGRQGQPEGEANAVRGLARRDHRVTDYSQR